MKDLSSILKKNSSAKLLAIFAHPDDESFVAGGLFQIAKEHGFKTQLICLTKGEGGISGLKREDLKKIRASEFKKAVEILRIDESFQWSYPDVNLRLTKSRWIPKVKQFLYREKPNIVITFDHSGITGHPDHIVSCHEILKLVKKMKAKPLLLWRVPDEQERHYFKENKALSFASKPNFKLDVGINKSIKKIKAIYAHKSQMQGFLYKLQILEWFLFDHKELYYKVDFGKKYDYKFVPFEV